MYFYVKLAGDEPIIIEQDGEITPNIDMIITAENVYFLMQVSGPDGQPATMPISGDDNMLGKGTNVNIVKDNITMWAELEDDNEIVKVIEKIKAQKSGIVTIEKPPIEIVRG